MSEQPDPPKDYYAILGVPPTADRRQIEAAYRSLARQHHPDAHPQGTGSDAEFKRVTEAYETLGDSQRRRQYDRRHVRPSPSTRASTSGEPTREAPPSVSPAGDPFGLFHCGFTAGPEFGAFGSKAPQAPRPSGIRSAGDVEVELPLSPEEATHGGPCEFTVSLAEACPEWRGESRPCRTCGGSGRVTRRVRLQVDLPPGLTSGEILRVPGRGRPARAGEQPGDLYLRIRVRPCWT